jgi:uncharacterized protein
MITQYQSIHSFWETHGDFIKQYECENNLMVANCISMLKQDQEDAFYASVTDKAGHILLALMIPPYPLVLFSDEDVHDDAYVTLAKYLIDMKIDYETVVAPNKDAERFITQLKQVSDREIEEKVMMRYFALDKVNPIKKSSGHLRLATMEDLPFLKNWVYEAVLDMTGELADGEKKAKAYIEDESIYLWVDDKPVSMAAKTRPTFSNITLSMVYTPKEYRKKGYASASVATLSEKLLNEGYKNCTLFTDLANPTSNKIYMEIGYKPLIDYIEYNFLKVE